MYRFCPLASGSKANALFLQAGQTKILIDAGLSARALSLRLEEIGESLDQIDAIVITHEHIDHIRGLAMCGGKKQIPIIANHLTAKAIYQSVRLPKGSGPIAFKVFATGEEFAFGDLVFEPFSIQHDAIDPVGFAITSENGTKLGICADTGFVCSSVVDKLKGCHILYVEANHQEELVHSSARPMLYKQRVLSRLGHLSNKQCRALLEQLTHPSLQIVYLAHLSSECNTKERALGVVASALELFEIELQIAHQDRVSKVFAMEEAFIPKKTEDLTFDCIE